MTDHKKSCLLALGYGYSARHLAAALDPDAWQVIGTCRSPDKVQTLKDEGVEALVFESSVNDKAQAQALVSAIGRASHILISAAPALSGDPFLPRARAALIERAKEIEWVGYLSTTGVYGNRDGNWVDESSDLNPTSDRGRWRVKAERAWLDLVGRSLPVHIFRLAGIYGLGRNAIEAVKAGTAKRLEKPGHVFSRIHVEDIAGVLQASMARPNPGRVYNLCDDTPAEPEKVVDYAAGMLGVLPPPLIRFEEAELSPMARSFYADNKKVMNARIKEELGYTLLYPGYREGLKALRDQLIQNPAKAG